MPNTKKRSKIQQKMPKPSGWSTSDDDEIERRRVRGISESLRVRPQFRDADFFGIYSVGSENGQDYYVGIRSLVEPINSCGCLDHRINGLGTCKHIDATLHRMQHRRKRAYKAAAARGSPFIEIFLDRRDQRVRIVWPTGSQRWSKAKALLTTFLPMPTSLREGPSMRCPQFNER